MIFSKLKALLRKAEEGTVEGPWNKTGDILPLFLPKERENYFKHAGFGQNGSLLQQSSLNIPVCPASSCLKLSHSGQTNILTLIVHRP